MLAPFFDMAYEIPAELQESYLKHSNYPENLIPTDVFTSTSKLTSYKTRLNGVEADFCLADHQVDGLFRIPVIDIGTADEKGRIAFPYY
jgi:hypothetical protein